MRKFLIIIFIAIAFISSSYHNIVTVRADDLSESVQDQLENIDLSELDEYFNSININGEIGSVSDIVNGLLKGEYTLDYKTVFDYVLSITFKDIKSYLPGILGIIAIALLCGVIDKLKPSFSSDDISSIIYFVCFMGIILLLSKQVIDFYLITQNTLENISKLAEIMSPIILTLMTAAGAKVSASIYSPTVAFLSSGIINIVVNFILPLVGFMTILQVFSNITTTVKLNKFAELCASTIKWVLGIVFSVFTFFLSTQGIASATFDGVSIKAAKYTISNSIPIVGGFLSGGLDLVVAGSVLIKNAVGVAIVIVLFYTIISKVLSMLVFSWLLKFLAALVESISDVKISNVCLAVEKCMSYMIALLLVVGLMLFITVILMIISANAFL